VKKYEFRIVEPGAAGKRPAVKGQANPVDGVMGCLNLTFCHPMTGWRRALIPMRSPAGGAGIDGCRFLSLAPFGK
jgi:hypothetical protein